jgi:Transcriptional Coactivator p15 (PC4)
MTDRIVATLTKNATEDLRITITEYYQGKPLLDLRVFTKYRTTGEVGPTKKGVTVKVELLPDLLAALRHAEAEARKMGLLS